MEPTYLNLDPDERINKLLAAVSIILGGASICAGIIPIAGMIGGALGLLAGFRGRRSESKKLATLGIIVSSFALLISIIYAILVYLKK